MSATTDNLNKRTRELEKSEIEKGEEMVRAQQFQNQVQALNDERVKNLALEKQENMAQNQILETMSTAGAMAAGVGSESSGGGMVVSPQTQATLGKYGLVGQPRISKTSHRDVQVKPNNIVINNTTNNTTTNNISGGGPLQGRPVSILPQGPSPEAKSQGRFKAWMENMFAQQKGANEKRAREYEKREWSLTKSINKMIRRMEDATRATAKALDPRGIGQTVGSQIKTLLFLFGIHFLAKNWDKIIDVGAKIFNGVKDFVSWLGIGEEGRKRRANGTDIRGTLIWFLTGDESKARNKKVSLLSILTDIFDSFRDHLKTWFEKQMALRGAAMKAIKFPDLNLDLGGGSRGLPGWFSGLMSGLSSIFSKTFSGVSTYLGDILTALVNPEAGAQRGVAREVKARGLQESTEAMNRDGEANMFKNHGDFNAGDYALEEKGRNGQRKYSLLANALDDSGDLVGTAAASVSQGRDILGTIKDAKEYGRIDTDRLVSGLSRLSDSARKKDGVIVDREFINTLFGPSADDLTAKGEIKPIRAKYIEDNMSARDLALEKQYMVGNRNWFERGLVSVAGNVGRESGKVLGTTVGAVGGLLSGHFLSGTAGGYIGGAAIGEASGRTAVGNTLDWMSGEGKDKKYTLITEDDPRYNTTPAAVIDGRMSGERTLYKITPSAIRWISQNKFKIKDGELNAGDPVLLTNAQDFLVQSGGGTGAINSKWNTQGKNQKFFKGRGQYGSDLNSEAIQKYREIKNLSKYYDEKLDNDKWSRYTEAWSNNTKYVANKAIGFVNSGIDWAANTYMDMTSAKNATFSFDKRPERPVDDGRQFNPGNAITTLHSNASPRPTGYCARAVRKAISAGLGIDTTAVTGSIGSAADYSGELGKLGFAPLNWNRYSPKVGDVLVEPRLPGHPHGHIAMFDGSRWVSDFPQRDMWGGTAYRHYKRGVVFRHLSMGGGEESALSVENNTQQAQDDSFYSYGSYVGGTAQFTASGNIGGVSASFSGSITPPTVSTSKDRGDWFNQHREKWYRFLGSKGYSEADSTRLSTFFAAQDGYESGGPNTKYAWDNHNWGGMKKGGKLLTYSSDEAYMEDKLKMMNEKFKNSLGASNLQEYIQAIHDPRVNNGYAYNVAGGFDAKTGAGWDKQQIAANNYVAGAMSYAQSGLQYSGSDSSLNPLYAQAKDGYDMEYDAPDIPTLGGVLSEDQLKKKQEEMKLREEGAKLWGMAVDSHLTLKDPTGTYVLSAEEFIDDYARGRISRSGTKRMIVKHHEGKMFVESIGKETKRKYLGGKDDKTLTKEYRVMSDEEQEGFRQGVTRIEEGKARYEDWYKDYFSKLTGEQKRAMAAAIGASNYAGGVDASLLKAIYENVLAGTFDGQRHQGSEEFMASVLYGPSYYNSSDAKKKSLRSNVGLVNQYMNENRSRKTGNAANSKVSQIMKLQQDIANIEEQKLALDTRYNKMIRDIGSSMTHEQYLAIADQYTKEYEDLLEHQNAIQKDIDKIVEQAKKNEKAYLEKAAQQARLIKASKENLQSEFAKLLDSNASFIDAINDMVNKYGEGVLEKLYGVKGLTKRDFEIEDFEKAMEEAKKSDEKLKEQYGDNIPLVIVKETDRVLESAWRMKAVSESDKGKEQGIGDRGAGKVISSSLPTMDWKGNNIGANKQQDFLIVPSFTVGSGEVSNLDGKYVKSPYSPSYSSGSKSGKFWKDGTEMTISESKRWNSQKGKVQHGTTWAEWNEIISKAEGGWIPGGPVNTPYHYSEGGEVTVHAGEYVVPKYMTQMPEVRRDVDKWERYRISTVAGQKVGSSKMKEPENYSEQMLTRQIQTNDLLELLIRSNAEGLSEVAQVTAKTIPSTSQPKGPTKPVNKFSYR